MHIGSTMESLSASLPPQPILRLPFCLAFHVPSFSDACAQARATHVSAVPMRTFSALVVLVKMGVRANVGVRFSHFEEGRETERKKCWTRWGKEGMKDIGWENIASCERGE